MENKIANINDLVQFLAVIAMRPLLNDEIWQCYGYQRRPRHGKIWDRISPKIFELENYITKEVLTMGFIDVLRGIKESTVAADTKLLISIGVLDRFLSVSQHLFSPDSFMENLASTYDSFLKCNKSNLHEPIILKAKDILDKKDFVKFMVGTIKLLGTQHVDGYFLNYDYIKNTIRNSSAESDLRVSMSKDAWRKYGALLSEKILNS